MFKFKHIALAASLAALTAGYSVAAEETFVTIGTGGVTGVYYPRVGLSVAWSINLEQSTVFVVRSKVRAVRYTTSTPFAQAS